MYALIAIGVLSVGLAASGWFILEQREDLGEAKAQLSTAIAASEANAEMWRQERADRERAQRIAARRQGIINDLESAASGRMEGTYNVAPEENGPIAAVLRRELDRLPEAAGPAAPDAGAGGGGDPMYLVPTPRPPRPGPDAKQDAAARVIIQFDLALAKCNADKAAIAAVFEKLLPPKDAPAK